jgi:hypothetical protein
LDPTYATLLDTLQDGVRSRRRKRFTRAQSAQTNWSQLRDQLSNA